MDGKILELNFDAIVLEIDADIECFLVNCVVDVENSFDLSVAAFVDGGVVVDVENWS